MRRSERRVSYLSPRFLDCHLDAALPNILEDPSASLSGTLRFLLVELKQELEQLAGHIEQAEMLIQKAAQRSEACQRLDAIPGIGPLTATALIAAIGNGAAFRKGREFAAWVGLVPREHSTGGKQKLLGISKRGNSYLRKLFVQGARAVLKYRDKQCSGLKHWLAGLSLRSHYNVVGVALANKLARMAWAVLASGDAYRPPVLDDASGLQIAAVQRQPWKSLRDSHIRKPATAAIKVLISRQVCWRIMRWHNGRTRRSSNPNSAEVLRDCVTNGERSAAHSILVRSFGSNKGRIHLRRPTRHSHFSLATKRRTIHVTSRLAAFPIKANDFTSRWLASICRLAIWRLCSSALDSSRAADRRRNKRSATNQPCNGQLRTRSLYPNPATVSMDSDILPSFFRNPLITASTTLLPTSNL